MSSTARGNNAPVDDSTQKQILKLKKEKGDLSKENAVLTQKLDFLKMQLEDESLRGEEHRVKHDNVLSSLQLQNDEIDKDRAGLEGMLSFKTTEGATLAGLVNELKASNGALISEKLKNHQQIKSLEIEVTCLTSEKIDLVRTLEEVKDDQTNLLEQIKQDVEV